MACPICGGGGGMGSKQSVKTNSDGSSHVTSYNPDAKVHYSHDVSPSGEISGRHWTNHETGNKIGQKDYD